MGRKKPSNSPSIAQFEELVEAALKVDPAGLSGKHKAAPKSNGKESKRRSRD
jgi:hypothetical protein